MTGRAVHNGWTLADVHDAVEGVPSATLALGVDVGRVRISTGDLQPGDVFVALQGSNSHGLAHWRAAIERGAVGIVAGSDAPAELVAEVAGGAPETLLRGGGSLADADGVLLLGHIARAWRRRCGYDVVGITGSSGKTSTKDILRGLLSGGRAVVASHANHNNEIGVPLTLLAAGADCDVVICEMGMRGMGQIAYLCEVAEPDVGVVTNAGSAHLELLGTLERIAAAKAELLAAVARDGTAVAPAWQPGLIAAAGELPERLLTFGGDEDAGADCRVLEAERTERGLAVALDVQGKPLSVEVPVHGLHQARNLAAAVCAYIAIVGSSDGLVAALDTIVLTSGRGDRLVLAGGGVLVDDAYNANPDSMRAALAELVAMDAAGGRRIAVLGSMAELGPTSGRYHQELGRHVAGLAVDELVVVANTPEAKQLAQAYEQASGRAPRVYGSADEAFAARGQWLAAGDRVLVKASNSVGLGRLAQALVESESDDALPTTTTDSEVNT